MTEATTCLFCGYDDPPEQPSAKCPICGEWRPE